MELAYTIQGDYLIPVLALPEEEMHIGKYGMLRKTYLKNHRRGIYASLMMSGKLNSHLKEIDVPFENELSCVVASTEFCLPNSLVRGIALNTLNKTRINIKDVVYGEPTISS